MHKKKIKSGLAGLQALTERATRSGKGPAPVEQWQPKFCGNLDIEIRRDGTWFYMGTPIGRQALVELFSTVLRKDTDGETYLVTPVEKIGIRVEDAPFVAVEMNIHQNATEQVLTFRTNVGDVVEAGCDNPLRFTTIEENDGIKPYILVRGRLEALLTRTATYELIACGEEIKVNEIMTFCVKSQGVIFPIMATDDLQRLSR